MWFVSAYCKLKSSDPNATSQESNYPKTLERDKKTSHI